MGRQRECRPALLADFLFAIRSSRVSSGTPKYYGRLKIEHARRLRRLARDTITSTATPTPTTASRRTCAGPPGA